MNVLQLAADTASFISLIMQYISWSIHDYLHKKINATMGMSIVQ